MPHNKTSPEFSYGEDDVLLNVSVTVLKTLTSVFVKNVEFWIFFSSEYLANYIPVTIVAIEFDAFTRLHVYLIRKSRYATKMDFSDK